RITPSSRSRRRRARRRKTSGPGTKQASAPRADGPGMSFIAGKLAWILLKPSNLLALIFALGLFLRALGRRRTGRAMMGGALAVIVAAAVLPLGAWLIAPLEN